MDGLVQTQALTECGDGLGARTLTQHHDGGIAGDHADQKEDEDRDPKQYRDQG